MDGCTLTVKFELPGVSQSEKRGGPHRTSSIWNPTVAVDADAQCEIWDSLIMIHEAESSSSGAVDVVFIDPDVTLVRKSRGRRLLGCCAAIAINVLSCNVTSDEVIDSARSGKLPYVVHP